MTGEAAIHDQLIAWLKRNGFAWFRSRMDQRTSTAVGDPDLVVVRGQRVAMLELKHGRGKLSPAQFRRHDELAEAGCVVCVARSLELAIAHIQHEFGTATGQPERGNGVSNPAPEPKLWLASAKHVGHVVVSRNSEGQMEYVRVATRADYVLPIWREELDL